MLYLIIKYKPFCVRTEVPETRVPATDNKLLTDISDQFYYYLFINLIEFLRFIL
jgi:hypothetical protein